MAAAVTLYRTTIGKKAVMAITGFIGYGFVIAHMIGNLKLFQGPEHFNEYAEFLRTVGEPAIPYGGLLWILRIVLIASVVLHVMAAVQLTRLDWESRGKDRYRVKKRLQSSFASMTLRWGGIALFLFILYHLAHFTFGSAHANFIRGDAYHNVIVGFQSPVNVVLYLVAIAALGMHLYHGVWSMFQTLGLNGPQTNGLWRGLAVLSGIGLFVGFMIVPFAVLAGLVS